MAHGNFALSNLVVTAAPLVAGADDAASAQVPIAAARADYSQPGLDVAGAFDDHPTSAWAIDPHVGVPHVAVFDFRSPVRHPGGSRVTSRSRRRRGKRFRRRREPSVAARRSPAGSPTSTMGPGRSRPG